MNRKKIILLIFAVVAVMVGGYFYAYVKKTVHYITRIIREAGWCR